MNNADWKRNVKMCKRIAELEQRLWNLGEFDRAPCFLCGYNGPRYYQPDTHPCARIHHKRAREALEEGARHD